MLKRIYSVLVVLLIGFSLSTIYIFYPSLPQSFDDKLRDFMFNIRGEIEPKSNSVVIIDIDEKSLKSLGQWPWSRDILSQVLENLNNAEIGIIALDIVFAEEDRTSPHKLFKKYNIENETVPNFDSLFAQTVSSTPTILGYQFELSDKDYISKKAPSIQTIIIERNKKLGNEYLLKAKGTILNIPIIQDNSYSSGFFNNIPDDSGIIRSVPLIISYEDVIYPSLALETLRLALNINKIYINYDNNGVENLQLDNYFIPTDRHGRILVNFRGKEKTFKYISALDIYNNDFKKEDIQNKIALVGTSAAALMDLRATPFESIFPGVEVHANVIDNILSKDYLYKPSWIEAVNLLLIFTLSFISFFSIKKIPIIFTPVFILASFYITFYSIYYILFNFGLILNILFPLISIALSTAISLIISYFYEIKRKEEIKTKFASKVSKNVMEELIKNIDNNQLKVQNKEITIFFSDIREFTKISEELNSPEILVSYLNNYLTPMSNIINKHDGTIDKYIGDCIMAYWNAPFDIDNHADKAVKSALEQLSELKVLNKTFEKLNQPKLEIGIGITTGIATVGEIGSVGRSDYTIIGDNVNIGSRIESLCKFYGTHLIISKDTKNNLKNNYIFRYLDHVKVKGKENSVILWEVISLENDENAHLKEELDNHNKAIDLYKASKFNEALELFEKLNTYSSEISPRIYEIYIERCNEFIENKTISYDSIYEHKTKS
jgi:adenylate cyclase